MVVQASENLVVSVDNHDGSQSHTHEEQSQWLQTIEVAQEVLRRMSTNRLPQGRARDERRYQHSSENDCAGGEVLVTFYRQNFGSRKARNQAFCGFAFLLGPPEKEQFRACEAGTPRGHSFPVLMLKEIFEVGVDHELHEE